MGCCVSKKQDDISNMLSNELYLDYYNEPTFDESLESIKILFLDVDGVLNGNRVCFKNLEQIIINTKCKIVLSTTWRLNENHKASLFRMMSEYFKEIYTGNIDGIKNELVIGDTPDVEFIFINNQLKSKNSANKDTNNDANTIIKECSNYKANPKITYSRAHEIDIYLRYNNILRERYNVINWIAIDDNDLAVGDHFQSNIMDKHFVKTNPNRGIQKNEMEQAIQLLNGNEITKTDINSQD